MGGEHKLNILYFNGYFGVIKKVLKSGKIKRRTIVWNKKYGFHYKIKNFW